MASSMTMTASFFGGAVAPKPAKATTRCSPLAVRASAAESSNTTRGLTLAGLAAAAASSDPINVALADVFPAVTPDLKALTPLDPKALDIITLSRFTVSEYNKRILASEPNNPEPKLLTFMSVLKADSVNSIAGYYITQVLATEGLGISTSFKKYTAYVLTVDEPGTVIFTHLELTS
ncbi:uncharacterized protein LOC125202302 [Salvia hispanica]|uniref:uncharacterized protein LOC125202302 n=1 Tax=Salvia hispanica TaxID=49212 RepID=UPI00200983D6|nr:uncharacterized protein LOC125202302 [Salvia hispanica]